MKPLSVVLAPEGDAAASEPLKVTTTSVVEEDEEVEETTVTTEAKEEDKEETTTTTKVEEEEKDERVHDDDPPDLALLYPEDGQHFEKKEVVFEGKAEPGAIVAAGPYVAESDDEGNWRIVLVLGAGANEVKFTATDPAGNHSYAVITVHYEKPTPRKSRPTKSSRPTRNGARTTRPRTSSGVPVLPATRSRSSQNTARRPLTSTRTATGKSKPSGKASRTTPRSVSSSRPRMAVRSSASTRSGR